MKKVILGAILSFAIVGCGTTPVINTDVTPDIQTSDIHSIVASKALTPLATYNSNLLTNGGFEDDLNGWAGCDTGVISNSSDSHSGHNAATVANNCFFQSVNVEPGKQYTLSCYIKETQDSGWTGMGFNFTDINWNIIGSEVSVEADAVDYKISNISREAPAHATYATMWVFSSGMANVDTCEIVEGGLTTPMPVEPDMPEDEMPAEEMPVTELTPEAPAHVEPEMPADEMPVETDAPVLGTSITDVAIEAGLTKLVAALKATGLDSVLAQDKEGPFTVFAPTDEAFDSILATLGITFEELAADAELLKQILLYHVILDELSLEILEEAQAEHDTRVETMSFLEDIDFGIFDGILYLDDLSGRTITGLTTDVGASNGIVHVIDTVLLPPSIQEAQAKSN